MARHELDERKRRILKAITDDYIASAEPVGSRTIARKYNLGLSPATIRNEMADLEEEGYLQQPHTSSGRIPSDRGYRYYVDALMEKRRLRPDEIEAIEQELAVRERALTSVMRKAARVLAQFTLYPAVVSPPNRKIALFKHIRLIRLNERNVMVLIVTDTGLVENKVIECEQNLDDNELERFSNMLNESLRDRPLREFDLALAQNILERMRLSDLFFRRTLQALIEGTQANAPNKLVMDGKTRILDQPEFADRQKVRPLLGLLEQEEMLYRLLSESCPGGVKVSIGQENMEEAMRDCSVVTAAYAVHERPVGIIAVLGPTRMDYGKILAVVEFIAAHLTSVLNDLAGP
ncbi:MAG: heat-inducible transcriptional repressor HrcA [Patescibacteria group bacterium]